jgi:methylglutaconyl-CoA hydratase
MEKFRTIEVDQQGPVATLWLSRPEVHNALDMRMILEITRFFSLLEEKDNIRAVIIRGRGKSFCAGADLRWMKEAFSLSAGENLKESTELSLLFRTIFESSKIVVAAMHGNVFGGGTGLAAASDLAYCTEDTRLSLSETKIGMAAASITPYLLQKIRPADLKELIFTAKIFYGREAAQNGLARQSFATQEEMDRHINETLAQMLENGTQAQALSKRLINRLTMQGIREILEQIPALLAQVRVSKEAREGFAAFLEKRKPEW